MPRPDLRLAVLAALCNAFVWGLSWLPLRWLEANGLQALWVTCAVFALCTALIVITRPSSVGELMKNRQLLWLVFAAGLTNVFFNTALVIGDVVRSVLLFYLMPVWVVFLARLLLNEPIRAEAIARVGLGLLGAMLVLGQGALVLPWPQSVADVLAVAAGFMFGLNNVLLRKHVHTPESARALAIFIGGFLLPPLAIWVLSMQGVRVAAPVFAPLPLAGLAGFACAVLLANLALQYAAGRLRANTLSIIMISEILFAALSAVLFGQTTLSMWTLLGGVLIVGASLLALWPAAKTLT